MIMKLRELRKQFIEQLIENDTPQSAIDFLSNDVHTLMFVEHLQHTEKITIAQMFDDVGFHEFLHEQFATPITFDEMIADIK